MREEERRGVDRMSFFLLEINECTVLIITGGGKRAAVNRDFKTV